MRAFFVSPVEQPLRPGRARREGDPACLVRHRPRHRLSRRHLEHRCRRPAHDGRHCRRRRRPLVLRLDGTLRPAADVLAGLLGGMAWAAIPAFLKSRLEVNEILVSLMLTYVATLVLSWLVYGPWKDPEGFNFPQTRLFSRDPADRPRRHPPACRGRDGPGHPRPRAGWASPARSGASRSRSRAWPRRPHAMPASGGRRLIWSTLLLSGGLAGLAGLFEVAGPIGQLVPVISPGYGFTAIIVAFLGRLHPLGILLASLLVALSYHRRRERADRGRAAAGRDRGLPGPAPVLPPRDRRAGALPHPHAAASPPPEGPLWTRPSPPS